MLQQLQHSLKPLSGKGFNVVTPKNVLQQHKYRATNLFCPYILLIYLRISMAILTTLSTPSHVAAKIFVFAEVNELWIIKQDFAAEVWFSIKDKEKAYRRKVGVKKCKEFKLSHAENNLTNIWRVK